MSEKHENESKVEELTEEDLERLSGGVWFENWTGAKSDPASQVRNPDGSSTDQDRTRRGSIGDGP